MKSSRTAAGVAAAKVVTAPASWKSRASRIKHGLEVLVRTFPPVIVSRPCHPPPHVQAYHTIQSTGVMSSTAPSSSPQRPCS